MIKWNVINESAKAAGTTPAKIVQSWIESFDKYVDAEKQAQTDWKEYVDQSGLRITDITHRRTVDRDANQHLIDIDYLFDNDATDEQIDWSQMHNFYARKKKEAQKLQDIFFLAMSNAGLINHEQFPYPATIAPEAYQIANGNLTGRL
jgi:hypothetical protein